MHQIMQQKENLLHTFEANIEEKFDTFRNMSMLLYYDEEVMRELQLLESDSIQTPHTKNLLAGIVNTENKISSAYITIGKHIISAGQTYQNFDRIRSQYTNDVLIQKGKVTFLPTLNLVTTYGMHTQCFIVARAINTPTHAIGVEWFFIPAHYLTQFFQPYYPDNQSTLYLINSSGQVIASSNASTIAQQLHFHDDIMTTTQYQPKVYENKALQRVYLTSRIRDSAWLFVEENTFHAIYGEKTRIFHLGIGIVCFFFLFIVLMYYLLASMVFNPLRQLRKAHDKVAQGNFDIILPKQRNDEIGELMDSYSIMTQRIKQLMDAVRVEEEEKTQQKIQVLSMQIGPHFVYNTLNTIKWMASINHQTNIKRMIEALIELMMSVTYNTNEEIPLAEELKLLDSYCYIQKTRYVNFQLQCDVPTPLLSYKVNKLILQPIVENSILYGFCQHNKQGTIQIKAHKHDNSLWIQVIDDGEGMDQATLLRIWEKTQPTQHHIGLKNVRKRIQLSHGVPYDVTISSTVGEGTTVTLRLPLITGEERTT